MAPYNLIDTKVSEELTASIFTINLSTLQMEVEGYSRFLHLLTRLHDVTPHKTVILIFPSV
jgi:hypothetical protein